MVVSVALQAGRGAGLGGHDNEARGQHSAISGGAQNLTAAQDSTVSGQCGLTTVAACQHLP